MSFTSIVNSSAYEASKCNFVSVATNKHKLLEWIQKQIPSLRVVNLSSSWSDGVALCALMEALCPGACPRYDLLKPHHKVNNCRLGLKLAHKYLGIPQVGTMCPLMKSMNCDIRM